MSSVRPSSHDSSLPPDDACDPRDQLIAVAARVLLDLLAAATRYPRLHLRSEPTLPGRWRVAHCCQTIYLHPDQSYPTLLQSIADALATLRSRPPMPAAEPCDAAVSDELAVRRRRRTS